MGFLSNHRGPFRLLAIRPHQKKQGFFTSEWLTGETARDDVEAEARALLADARDTISSLFVWSVREECFVGGYK